MTHIHPRMAARAASALFATILILGCGPSGDGGYVGVWERGNDRVRSSLEIHQDQAGEWWVRWLRSSDDDRAEVTCQWGEPCEEWVDGTLAGTHRFEASMDEARGVLMVRIEADIRFPTEIKSTTVDELVLEPDGLALWSFTNERDGQTFEGDGRPKRKLVKIADRVSEPPPGN